MKKAFLILEDGTKFIGTSIGIEGIAFGEVVFNTALTGYQEIISDPSYFRQIILFTYPNIGNVGTNILDNQSSIVYASGIIVKDFSKNSSNYRNDLSFCEYLKYYKIIGIANIDTRKLTRLLQISNSKNGCIISTKVNNFSLIFSKLKSLSLYQKKDFVAHVTTKKQYIWVKGNKDIINNNSCKIKKRFLYRVVVYDYGIKKNIMRILVDKCCYLIVVPAKTSFRKVIDLNPDGIFLSNGPGNPSLCFYAIESIKVFIKKNIPLFGICLGYQLLALSCGAKVIKMDLGHHGSNHPVLDLKKKKIIITSQNHGFSIDKKSIPNTLKITHISCFDKSIQGIEHINKFAFGFQGHPEGSPGPHDALYLFDHFIYLIKIFRGNIRNNLNAKKK